MIFWMDIYLNIQKISERIIELENKLQIIPPTIIGIQPVVINRTYY